MEQDIIYLWIIEPKNYEFEYDTFEAAIVAAKDETEARRIHPNGKGYCLEIVDEYDAWVGFDNVVATLIGVAKVGTSCGVILSRFNAG
jgi:hypothetical protein